MNRRTMLAGVAGLVLAPGRAAARPAQEDQADPLRQPSAAGRPRAPVTDAMNDEIIKTIELRLGCTCPCTLDIYTCRTTDFTCTYSPQLHEEVVALWNQHQDAEQVIAAFVAKYGEEILMAPKAEGFNVMGYIVPGLAVLAAGGILAAVLLRRQRLAPADAAMPAAATAPPSREDLQQLEAALKEVAD